MRNVWITDEPMPASEETLAAAAKAGADEILHGIPPILADVISPDELGFFELVEPEPPEPEPTVEEVLTARIDALTDKLVEKSVISEKDRGDIAVAAETGVLVPAETTPTVRERIAAVLAGPPEQTVLIEKG